MCDIDKFRKDPIGVRGVRRVAPLACAPRRFQTSVLLQRAGGWGRNVGLVRGKKSEEACAASGSERQQATAAWGGRGGFPGRWSPAGRMYLCEFDPLDAPPVCLLRKQHALHQRLVGIGRPPSHRRLTLGLEAGPLAAIPLPDAGSLALLAVAEVVPCMQVYHTLRLLGVVVDMHRQRPIAVEQRRILSHESGGDRVEPGDGSNSTPEGVSNSKREGGSNSTRKEMRGQRLNDPAGPSGWLTGRLEKGGERLRLLRLEKGEMSGWRTGRRSSSSCCTSSS